MKRIKIIHIAQSAGGVDKYLQMLLKYLDNNLFENIIIASQDFSKDNYKDLSEEFVTIPMQRAVGKNDVVSAFKIRKMIKKYNPDIVYLHSSKAGALGRIANIGLNNYCIYNPHGWSFNMAVSLKKIKFYKFFEKIAANFCDKIICISDREKQSAIEAHISNESKLEVIYNGIDIDKYEIEKEVELKRIDCNIPENSFVVGMVGRISQQKSPDVFAQVAKRIKKSIPNAYFIIVGSGDMEREITDYIENNNLSDCFFITGWVNDSMPYIKLFDVACLLSRWEGFGLVLPEYMLAQVPIVATAVDAIPDIIRNGENGLLVKSEDANSVYDAILKINNNEALKNNLVLNGKKDVYQRFNVQRVAKEHEKLFLKLLNK